MTFTVTIEVPASTAVEARRVVSAHGYTVKRVAATRNRAATATTERHPFRRASATLDMPTNLTPDERKVYLRGYAKGAMTYVKKHGAPSVQGGGASASELTRMTVDHEWERHPACHAVALKELAAWRDKFAAVLTRAGVAA